VRYRLSVHDLLTAFQEWSPASRPSPDKAVRCYGATRLGQACPCASCLAEAPDKATLKWIRVDERLPSVDQLVMVYSPPTQYDHPGEVNINFDCIDPNDDDHASWLNHNEHYEHFCCVAKPEGSIGPSEKAPYTHWMPIPPPPGAVSQPLAQKAGMTDEDIVRIGAGLDAFENLRFRTSQGQTMTFPERKEYDMQIKFARDIERHLQGEE